MCGIIGVVGAAQAAQSIVSGLQRLEYRGYDSAGLAVVTADGLKKARAVGPVKNLAAMALPAGLVGIGHTRWATHGGPTEQNAHPHTDCTGRFAVVHNGIIENYRELREMLEAEGHVFTSQTDTEVLSHLVERHYEGSLVAAVRATTAHLEGSYALVVVSADSPDRIVAARMKSPLLVGIAEGRSVLASDATALLDHTRRVIFLEDGDVVELYADRVDLLDVNGVARVPVVHELAWTVEAAEKGGFEHFMLKEIHDIPEAFHEVLRGRVSTLGRRFDVEGGLTEQDIRSARRIVVLACGTSHYAGLVGKSILESVAGIPVEVHLASEYRYAPALPVEDTLVVLVSQSGETADTLEAMRRARQSGCKTLAFVNVVGSTLAREAHGVFYLRAGPEIGVASTKAFVNMLGGFYLLGLHLGHAHGRLTPARLQTLVAELRTLPRLAQQTLEKADSIREMGESFFQSFESAFFLGRQINHGVAMEGALKLKEISYIHAEGYAAGELKHGPLALLVPGLPVVALLPHNDPTYGVMVSNIGEVRARREGPRGRKRVRCERAEVRGRGHPHPDDGPALLPGARLRRVVPARLPRGVGPRVLHRHAAQPRQERHRRVRRMAAKTPSFGSSGVRGPFDGFATPELALALGRAVGAMRRRVVVGRDARTTGPLLQSALVAGLLASGAQVETAGVLPTPALAYATRSRDAGVVITASHNPAPDNGFKLWEPDGRAFGAKARSEVEAALGRAPLQAAWDAVGRASETSSAIPEHIERILDLVGPLRRKLRVVVDCGNGAASLESPELLRRLGCDVLTLNAQPDGTFPGRPSEPSAANLTALRKLVVASGAELGIAHDGDADRCMLVTHTGRYVEGDELLLLFARERAPGTIVCPVDASRTIEDASGCRVERTRVGDAHVSERLADIGGAFGGEASGAWIFPEMSYCPDGPLAAALACRMVVERGPLEDAVAALPRYPLFRHAWRLPPDDIPLWMERFKADLSDGDVTTLDGVRADFPEGWVLVRPSGTEPKLRVTIEAVDEAGLERLKARVGRTLPF